jgi:hypothetical protein
MKQYLMTLTTCTVLFTLAGCSSNPMPFPPGSAVGSMPASPAPLATNVVYIETAPSGLLSANTLTLNQASQQTFWLNQLPIRKYGSASTAIFIQYWNRNSQGVPLNQTGANAVLMSISTQAGIPDKIEPIPVVLSQPIYDLQTQTLTYQLKFLSAKDVPAQPQSLRDISIFIENGSPAIQNFINSGNMQTVDVNLSTTTAM